MQPKTIAIVASVVLLAALVSLRFTLRPSMPKVNPSILTSLGQVLAQETASAVHDRGQVVAVVADAYDQFGTVLRDQWKAFADELKKHPSVSLAAPEIRQPGSHTPLGEVLDRHPQASAVVFFVDAPDALELEAVAIRPSLPKIVAVGNPDVPAKNYYGNFLTSGLLAALIIPRSISDVTQSTELKTPREWVDRYYQVYTPQNFDILPE